MGLIPPFAKVAAITLPASQLVSVEQVCEGSEVQCFRYQNYNQEVISYGINLRFDALNNTFYIKMTNNLHESRVQKYPSDLCLVEMPVEINNDHRLRWF